MQSDVFYAQHWIQAWCCAGTGKTHTVRGILNVWHIVHYNRFLESLVKALARYANLPPAPWSFQHTLRVANHLHLQILWQCLNHKLECLAALLLPARILWS